MLPSGESQNSCLKLFAILTLSDAWKEPLGKQALPHVGTIGCPQVSLGQLFGATIKIGYGTYVPCPSPSRGESMSYVALKAFAAMMPFEKWRAMTSLELHDPSGKDGEIVHFPRHCRGGGFAE